MNQRHAAPQDSDLDVPSATPSGPQPPPTHPVLMSVTTLGQLGSQLPVGVVNPGIGKRVKPFRLRQFRMKQEKELGELRENGRGMSFGKFVSEVMAKMVQTVGHHTFDSMGEKERKLVLAQMTMADVLYMYVWLRHEAMGADEPVVLPVTCPGCRHMFQVDADLGTLEVRTVPAEALDLRRTASLRDGLTIHGKQCSNLWLDAVPWRMADSPAFMRPGEREALVINHSIVGAEGVDLNPFLMTDAELDEMTKFDLEGLMRDIDDNSPGPIMVVKSNCPACKSEVGRMIDWGYDSFFSRSSRRSRGKV